MSKVTIQIHDRSTDSVGSSMSATFGDMDMQTAMMLLKEALTLNGAKIIRLSDRPQTRRASEILRKSKLRKKGNGDGTEARVA